MTNSIEPRRLTNEHEKSERIARKAARKLKAQGEKPHALWFGLGMFGLVGWSIAVPTILGILAGLWIDRHVGGRLSWTVALLFAGLVLGCVNAWYWVRRESRSDRNNGDV